MSGFRVAAFALIAMCARIDLAYADVPLTGATSVAAGFSHSCALTAGGGVKCWGNNSSGELGNGTADPAQTAIDVTGLSSGVAAIALGGVFGASHSCAVTTAGAVKCWGSALPNGTGSQAFVPMQVPGLTSGMTAVSAGGLHTCALTSGGGMKCWGLNDAGQIGTGTTNNAHAPVDVTGLTSDVIAIAAGGFHTCALTSAGGVKCWGENVVGQLGIGPGQLSALTPVDVSGLTSGVAAISAGDFHTCALTTGGGIKCWGSNDSGQVGNGSTTQRIFTPVDVTGLTTGMTAITAGRGQTCALTTGGGAKCWGWGVLNATDVPGLTTGVSKIAAGGNVCVVIGGGVQCWGGGLLGNGSSGIEPRAVGVVGLFPGAIAIAAGGVHSCALTPEGAAKCWGGNGANQLGNGTANNALMPTSVTGLSSGVAAIAGGWNHTCAVTSAGGAKCWGFNQFGEIGNGTTTPAPSPVDVTGLTAGVAAIAPAGAHTCALTTGGGVKCWGGNGAGQLGNGTMTDALSPVDVTGLGSGVIAIDASEQQSCAITGAGGLKCWGRNEFGQLGDGTMMDAMTPVDVVGLTSGVASIAVGGFKTCALTTSGGVKCWGAGYLGNGTSDGSLTPVDVTGLTSGVRAIVAGNNHSCALTVAGAVKCWGGNAYGQIGRGDVTSDALVPFDVVGLGSGVVAIAAGGDHACALLSGGVVNCWGSNDSGQLGNGKAISFSQPQVVVIGACVDLLDIDRASPFCPNVEWIRNRIVTQGCRLGEYCPSDPVIRLAMAAFMNRLGTALTQAIAAVQQAVGAIDPDAAPVVCATTDVAVSAFPRRVHLDGVFRGLASSDAGLVIVLVASIDSGATWQKVAVFDNRVHFKTNRWSNVRTLGNVDIAANQTPRFGLRVSRGGLPGAGALTDANCHLRARIDNRTATAAPF